LKSNCHCSFILIFKSGVANSITCLNASLLIESVTICDPPCLHQVVPILFILSETAKGFKSKPFARIQIAMSATMFGVPGPPPESKSFM